MSRRGPEKYRSLHVKVRRRSSYNSASVRWRRDTAIALAHRLCNALDAVCAHVARRKNSMQAGFEHLRAAIQRPPDLLRHGIKIAGENKSFVVECHLSQSVRGEVPAMMNTWPI